MFSPQCAGGQRLIGEAMTIIQQQKMLWVYLFGPCRGDPAWPDRSVGQSQKKVITHPLAELFQAVMVR